jgi:hypothetical protein
LQSVWILRPILLSQGPLKSARLPIDHFEDNSISLTTTWQACQYEDGATEEFDPNFLRELAEKIHAMGLEHKVSLGSSKKSLGTREMEIPYDATASFTSSCLGDSWASVDVKVLEVGWGFITSPARPDGPDAIVVASYTGHATGNHVVLYTSSCSYANGLLENSVLENSSEILRELKLQGWIEE